MLEMKGDFWEIKADWKCIPVNAMFRSDGSAIMGAGLAKQARDRFPMIELALGNVMRQVSSQVTIIQSDENNVAYLAFPTKRHWRGSSDLGLIEISTLQLKLAWLKTFENPALPPRSVLLPRVGCGEGGLSWEHVKPILERILPERNFIVCYL